MRVVSTFARTSCRPVVRQRQCHRRLSGPGGAHPQVAACRIQVPDPDSPPADLTAGHRLRLRCPGRFSPVIRRGNAKAHLLHTQCICGCLVEPRRGSGSVASPEWLVSVRRPEGTGGDSIALTGPGRWFKTRRSDYAATGHPGGPPAPMDQEPPSMQQVRRSSPFGLRQDWASVGRVGGGCSAAADGSGVGGRPFDGGSGVGSGGAPEVRAPAAGGDVVFAV